MKRRIPPLLVWLLLVIFLLNGIAVAFSLYWLIWWFDMPMHFLGGVWVAGMTLWYFAASKPRVSFGKALGVAILSVTVVGGLWEIFEFGVDRMIVVPERYDMIDTSSDMLFDILGALCAAIVFTCNQKQK